MSDATLYVKKGGEEKARTTAPWSSFGTIVGIQYVESIESAENEISLYYGASRKLEVVAKPDNADNAAATDFVWTSSNPDVVTVDAEGIIKAVGKTGTAIITVSSTDMLKASAEIRIEVTGVARGDSDGNGNVTVTDAVNTANYAVGNEVENFVFEGADVNSDSKITIADAVGTITEVFNQPATAQSRTASALSRSAGDRIMLSDVAPRRGELTMMDVRLDNTINYVALQADIALPEGTELESIEKGERASHHALTYRSMGGNVVRVVLFNPDNEPFGFSDAPLLSLKLRYDGTSTEPVVADNIIAADAAAGEYTLTSTGGNNNGYSSAIDSTDAETAVEIIGEEGAIRIRNAEGRRISVYAINGVAVASLTGSAGDVTVSVNPGLYVVAADNYAVKVAVK